MDQQHLHRLSSILWIAFILNFIVLYFTGAWTNIILQSAGVPQTQAIIVSSLNQGGGVMGGLMISYFVDRYGFLAVMAWGILTAARPTLTFFLSCVIVAGIYGAITVSKKIAFVQALPAAIVLALMYFV